MAAAAAQQHTTLASQYAQQAQWRAWDQALALLPIKPGDLVIDAGCAVGQHAMNLAAKGATVIGVDSDAALLAEAQNACGTAACSFHCGDITQLPQIMQALGHAGRVSGIWCSFTAAYFPGNTLQALLSKWHPLLQPTAGWLALTEVSGMLEHEPVSDSTRQLLRSFQAASLADGRYDFDAGAKLAGYMEQAGFMVQRDIVLPDAELSFQGPASPEVLAAWAARLDRMPRLQAAAGPERWPSIRQELLDCFAAAGHSTGCKVHFVMGQAA